MEGKNSFLIELYQGNYEHTYISSYRSWAGSQKVETILGPIQEYFKNIDPKVLEANNRIPEEAMNTLKEVGLFGLTIPEIYGGLGCSVKEYLKIVEKLAEYDMSVAIIPLAHLSIGLKGILLYGNEEQKKKYLTPASRGDMIFAYALTEPLIGSDASNITTKAEISEDGKYFIVNGTKTYITNGGYAGGLTVFAQVETEGKKKMVALIVETAWEGVIIGKDMDKMGLKISSTTSIQFKNVQVPKENLLGSIGDGFKIAVSILNYGRLGLAAASIGVINKSYEDMKKRANKRIQFSTPIKNFELIQEKLVKARIYSLTTEAIMDFTAGMLDENPLVNAAIESSHCKLYGTNKAWDILYEAQQLAGGAGYLKTTPYEKRLRDFRITTIFEGTSEIHTVYPPLIIARNLLKMIKGKSGLSTVLFFMGISQRNNSIHINTESEIGTRIKSEVSILLRLIKKLITRGMLRYRKRLQEREYYLRSITQLSLFLFILVTMSLNHAHRREYTLVINNILLESKNFRASMRNGYYSTRETNYNEIFTQIDK